MRDMRYGRAQQRMRRRQPLIVLDIAPAYERAEPEAVIADGNIAEPGQPPQIDQQAWGHQTEGEKRHQALSPGDDERFGVRREQVDCFAKGAGSLVIEGRRFHCYTLRGKTASGATCRFARAPSARPPNGRTSIMNSQRRYPSSKCARAYRSMTPSEPLGCAERRSGPDRGCWRRARAQPSAASSRWAPMPISAFDADSIFGRPTRRPAARRHRAVFLNLTSPIRALRST